MYNNDFVQNSRLYLKFLELQVYLLPLVKLQLYRFLVALIKLLDKIILIFRNYYLRWLIFLLKISNKKWTLMFYKESLNYIPMNLKSLEYTLCFDGRKVDIVLKVQFFLVFVQLLIFIWLFTLNWSRLSEYTKMVI